MTLSQVIKNGLVNTSDKQWLSAICKLVGVKKEKRQWVFTKQNIIDINSLCH